MAQTQSPPREIAPTEAKTPDEVELEITLGLDPSTELRRRLIAARREFSAKNGRLLTPDEIAREVAQRRAGVFEEP